jgi:hypothetical protein
LGIKKRIEKLESLRVQNRIPIDEVARVECGENGYPVDEENVEFLRKAEAARAGRQGIWVIRICQAGVLGLDQKIKAAAQSPTLDGHIEST